MPRGIQTPIVAGGQNLSRGQRQRLLIARAVVDHPQLLILDEAFTGIEERTRQRILDALWNEQNAWTILAITHLDEVVVRCQELHLLSGGTIVESGVPRELAIREDGEFTRLFPFLRRVLDLEREADGLWDGSAKRHGLESDDHSGGTK